MTSIRYGTAVHEAGHVIVARALGLRVESAVVGIDGDETAGGASIEDCAKLHLIDRVALCWAGVDAQRLLDAQTHGIAGLADEIRIDNLLEHLDETVSEVTREAGHRRSEELLRIHRADVERLAEALTEQGELNNQAIERILASTAPQRGSL